MSWDPMNRQIEVIYLHMMCQDIWIVQKHLHVVQSPHTTIYRILLLRDLSTCLSGIPRDINIVILTDARWKSNLSLSSCLFHWCFASKNKKWVMHFNSFSRMLEHIESSTKILLYEIWWANQYKCFVVIVTYLLSLLSWIAMPGAFTITRNQWKLVREISVWQEELWKWLYCLLIGINIYLFAKRSVITNLVAP